jgi:hypothetical protein
LRPTTSEQLAEAAIEHDAAMAVSQDPMMTHTATPPHTEAMTPPTDGAVFVPRRQGATSLIGSPAGRDHASSLFAPPQKIATTSAPPPRPASSEPHRSLFGRVTGVLGFRHIAEPEVQTEAAASTESALPSEQVGPTVRQTTAEDIGIGIPKFLLRQTSGAAAPHRR